MFKVGIFIGRFQPLHNVHLQTILNGFTKSEPIDHLIIFIGSDQRPETLYQEKLKLLVKKELLEGENKLLEEENKLLELCEKEPLKNPYFTNFRKFLIEESIREVAPELLSKITILGLKDSNHPNYLGPYRPREWEENLSNMIQDVCSKLAKEYVVYLFGSAKDQATGNYINNIIKSVKINGNSLLLHLIEPVKTDNNNTLDATTVRSMLRKYHETKDNSIIADLKKFLPNAVLKYLI